MKEGMTERNGFTIVELLTVMGVIAVLIGLLVPALNLVKDRAKEVQQQAQFHGIEAALEMFSADFGYYPESNDNSMAPVGIDPTPYTGANKLAEALIGLDYLGFHPNSDFRSNGMSTVILNTGEPQVARVYRPDQGLANWQTVEQNVKARKGPYIEFENANAFRMDEVYSDGGLTQGQFVANFQTTDTYYPLVLCDVFSKKRSGSASAAAGGVVKKTGTPVLYYRARTNYVQQDLTDAGGMEDDIYYFPDNQRILMAGSVDNYNDMHPLADAANPYQEFENMILNRQVQDIQRPYRAGSYILISAGNDGLFGTGDDVFNFNKEVQ